MAWFFGDGFDLYQQFSDAYMGGTYWDSGTASNGYEVASSGRFSGSRGLSQFGNSTSGALVKSSGSNDTTHHINFAYTTTTALSGTNKLFFVTLSDGATAQCTLAVRSDGAILLYSGAASSTTVLATYTGAVTATSTWYSFECEVVINGSTGSFKVRKNGNTSDDSSTTGLNTRASANNYANKVTIGSVTSTTHTIDDFLWRSDSSVSWAGDVRCFTRMPSTDATAAWTRSGSVVPVTPFAQSTTGVLANGVARYAPFIATSSGTVGTAVVSLSAGYTGNMKCTLFNDGGTSAGTILSSATAISNPVTGNNTFTFSSPPTVVQGTKYWIGFDADVNSGSFNTSANTFAGTYPSSGHNSSTVYASFPVASPVVSSSGLTCPIFTVNITPTTISNSMLVAEVVQDGAVSYLSDSTLNDADFYNIQTIGSTPSTILGVVTRGICQKSDAGSRSVALQVKSGGTTSTGTSTALNTTFGWIFKTDTVDPNTSAAWTATAVNNMQIGPKVTV